MRFLSTYDTDAIIRHIQAEYEASLGMGIHTEEFFLQHAIALAELNVRSNSGGPFGAILTSNDIQPRILGVGVNHVVPLHDPTAHAEIMALRDAARRYPDYDFTNTILYSSCECCPMCLTAIIGSGIGSIFYSCTTEDADEAGFSDARQYALCRNAPNKLPFTSLSALPSEEQTQLLAALADHGAAVIAPDGSTIATGDDSRDVLHDPTAIASVQAIRNACSQLQQFDLSNSYRLLTRDKPHPTGFMASDWAYIGYPSASSQATRDPLATIYCSNNYEEMINSDAQTIYCQPSLPNRERIISTRRYSRITHAARSNAFYLWKDAVKINKRLAY